MNKEKLQTTVYILIGAVSLIFLSAIAIRYVLPILLPFIIAWGVAFAVRAPARYMSLKSKIPERILRVAIAILTVLLAFGLLALLVWQLSASVWRFLSDIGEGGAISDFLSALVSPNIPIFSDLIPEGLKNKIEIALGDMLTGVLSTLANAVTSWVSLIPGAFLFLLVTVISLVYFAYDLENINTAVKRLLPRKLSERLSVFRKHLFGMGSRYLGSYLVIMIITFVIMLTGMLILGIEHAALTALIISLLDVLPVIGVGTLLVPWSIVSLVTGDLRIGVGLVILLIVNETIRQFAEPKIVGKSLNLHPILTLVFLYGGYALFGFAGLILVPVFSVIIAILFKEKSAAEID